MRRRRGLPRLARLRQAAHVCVAPGDDAVGPRATSVRFEPPAAAGGTVRLVVEADAPDAIAAARAHPARRVHAAPTSVVGDVDGACRAPPWEVGADAH